MSETRLVSADTSTTCTGLALYVDGELKDYAELKPKSKDIEQRMYDMAWLIQLKLNEWKPDIVYIETPQGHGANVKLARNLGEMLGVVLGWCSVNNAQFNEVAPSQWRAWAGFKQGKLERADLKKLSMKLVKDRHGINVGDDVADAINIGYGVIQHLLEDELFE